VLDCSYNNLHNVLGLSNCDNLTEMHCDFNLFADADFLTELPNPERLTYLNISNCNFSNQQTLNFLTPFTNLKELYLSNANEGKRYKQRHMNRFTGSLKPLLKLTKLEKLDLKNTDISSGSEFLTEIKELQNELNMEREMADKSLKTAQEWRERQLKEITETKDKRIKELEQELEKLKLETKRESSFTQQSQLLSEIMQLESNPTNSNSQELDSKKQQLKDLETKAKELIKPLPLDTQITILQKEIQVLESKPTKNPLEKALLVDKKKKLAELLSKQDNSNTNNSEPSVKTALYIGSGVIGVILIGCLS
ncbi:15032_t:CDS:2, partial [Funneliformis geosporum]